MRGALFLDSVSHIWPSSREAEAAVSWCGQCRFLMCLKRAIGRLWCNQVPVNFPMRWLKTIHIQVSKGGQATRCKCAKFRERLRPWQQHCRWVENTLGLELEARDLKTVSRADVLPVTKTHCWRVRTQPLRSFLLSGKGVWLVGKCTRVFLTAQSGNPLSFNLVLSILKPRIFCLNWGNRALRKERFSTFLPAFPTGQSYFCLNSSRALYSGARRMAQWINCLLHNQENLCSGA